MTPDQIKILVSEEGLRGVLEKLLPILHDKISRDDVDQFLSEDRVLEIIDEIIAIGYFDGLFRKQIEEDPDRFKAPSNYELWLAAGNVGSFEDFFKTLRGQDAYELAVEQGFTGTLLEWLALKNINPYSIWYLEYSEGRTTLDYLDWMAEQLAAHKGDKGEQGKIGNTGKSNYDLAVEDGFVGTLTEWLETIGINSYDFWYRLFQQGKTLLNYPEWIAEQIRALKGDQGEQGQIGSPGKSNYELAVSDGFIGNLTEWLSTVGINSYDFWYRLYQSGETVLMYPEWISMNIASLKGDKGDAGKDGPIGKSNYDLAKDDGFEGTLSQWLNTVNINSYDFWQRLYILGETALNYPEWIANQLSDLSETSVDYEPIPEAKIKTLIEQYFVIGEIKDGNI